MQQGEGNIKNIFWQLHSMLIFLLVKISAGQNRLTERLLWTIFYKYLKILIINLNLKKKIAILDHFQKIYKNYKWFWTTKLYGGVGGIQTYISGSTTKKHIYYVCLPLLLIPVFENASPRLHDMFEPNCWMRRRDGNKLNIQ